MATLRRPTAEDAVIFAEWGADREFCEQAGWSLETSIVDRRARWSAIIAEPPSDLIRLVACMDDEVVGYVDLHGTDHHRRELGYVVGGRERWHRGIGTQVAIAGLAYGFRVLGLRTIWAEAIDANTASVAILRRIGMRETGRGDDAVFVGVHSFYRQFEINASEFSTGTD